MKNFFKLMKYPSLRLSVMEPAVQVELGRVHLSFLLHRTTFETRTPAQNRGSRPLPRLEPVP